MASKIGQDLFILGFPMGIMNTGILPIWKRALIASEPGYPVNSLPCFLIDTTTRVGISGVPVIQQSTAYQANNGSTIIPGVVDGKLIDIYSGQYIGELGEAQMRIVWHRGFMEEIISNPAIGSIVIL